MYVICYFVGNSKHKTVLNAEPWNYAWALEVDVYIVCVYIQYKVSGKNTVFFGKIGYGEFSMSLSQPTFRDESFRYTSKCLRISLIWALSGFISSEIN